MFVFWFVMHHPLLFLMRLHQPVFFGGIIQFVSWFLISQTSFNSTFVVNSLASNIHCFSLAWRCFSANGLGDTKAGWLQMNLFRYFEKKIEGTHLGIVNSLPNAGHCGTLIPHPHSYPRHHFPFSSLIHFLHIIIFRIILISSYARGRWTHEACSLARAQPPNHETLWNVGILTSVAGMEAKCAMHTVSFM